MRFRGVHIVNRGLVVGSANVVRKIVASQVLVPGYGMHGHGVYGHYLENRHLYEDAPYVVFEAEIERTQLRHCPATTGAFFVILTEHDLPIQMISCENLDEEVTYGSG